jgi:hypothetical protein
MRWVWWSVVGLVGFVACGGVSIRNDSGDGGDDGSTGGGSAGTREETGGASPGGTSSATGGRGITIGGQGGSGARGGTPSTGGDGGRGAVSGDAGGGGDAGAGAGGVSTCELAGGTSCSFAATCAMLGCGTPWSSYDENLCVRANCALTGVCEAGERCVAAPVAGGFDDPCGNQADSCDATAVGCQCVFYEECFPSAVCLPFDAFPPEKDCPIANLNCGELERAAMTLRAYLDGGSERFLEPYQPPANLAASLRSCADAVAARMARVCKV